MCVCFIIIFLCKCQFLFLYSVFGFWDPTASFFFPSFCGTYQGHFVFIVVNRFIILVIIVFDSLTINFWYQYFLAFLDVEVLFDVYQVVWQILCLIVNTFLIAKFCHFCLQPPPAPPLPLKVNFRYFSWCCQIFIMNFS